LAAKIGCIALVVMLTATCDSMVGPESVAYVAVTPASWSPTALGDTIQFIAVAKSAFGKVIPVPVTWTTEPFGVMTVQENGVAIAHNTGTAQVHATIGGVMGTATVHVSQTIESVVILTYFGNQIAVGDSTLLYVDARDRNSFSVPGANFSIKSLDPSIATVSLEGWIKGKSAGEVSIVAMAAGKTDTAGFVIIP
jgi:hypothetical protein